MHTWELCGNEKATGRVVVKADFISRVKLAPGLHERLQLAGYDIGFERLVNYLGYKLWGGVVKALTELLALYQQPRLRVQMLSLWWKHPSQ